MNKLKNVLNRILILFLTAALLSGSLQGAVYAEEVDELQGMQEISEVTEIEEKSVSDNPALESEQENENLPNLDDEQENQPPGEDDILQDSQESKEPQESNESQEIEEPEETQEISDEPEPYTYQISYVLNGGENHEDNPTGYYGGTEKLINDPVRTGYQFKGWYLDSKFKKKFEQIQADTIGNKKLYAKWSKETYPINYALDGGKNNSSNPKSYQITTSTIKLKNPSKKGHTFKGWYLEETFKTQIFQISKGSVGEITLYAKWELTPYSIQYVLGSGAVNHEANPTTYTMEMPTISFETPTRKGYIFKGWYTNSEYKKKFVEILEGSTGNKKVYAKWSKEKYTINYALDGGKNNSSNPKIYYLTTSTIKLKNPSKKGYTFKGWYLEKTFENPISAIPKGSVGNVTLYAKWELTDYTITYVLGDGGINADNNPETYTMLSPTITFENPSRNGSIFKGWYSDSQYKKKITQITEGTTGNKKIYAKWSNIKYNITYLLDGGKNNSKNPKSYDVTTSTIKLKNPTKKGYTFLGWYLDNTFETSISEIPKGSYENLTLYAKWELAEYTITYVGVENEGLNPECYSINTPTIYFKNPEKEGYTFKGWYSDSKYKNKISKISKGSTGNKKIYAKWSAHQYTIKFNGNGATSGSMKDLSGCKYDKNYTLTSNKYKKLWFTFVGWNTEPDGSGITYQNKESIKNLVADNKGTVTLYAQWEMLFNKKGVDVSSWQGTINWSKVKNAGIDFAMIRILSGGVSNMEADSQFENNYKNARNAGISVGVYRYSYALSVEQAKQEARKVLKVLNGRHLDYPIVLDMEYSSMLTNISSNAKRTDLVLAFKKIIEDAGYEFAMYANLNWVNNYLDMDRLSDVNLWLARWRPLEQGPGYTGKGKLMMWQYTSEGTVPGISGDVDLNVGY